MFTRPGAATIHCGDRPYRSTYFCFVLATISFSILEIQVGAYLDPALFIFSVGFDAVLVKLLPQRRAMNAQRPRGRRALPTMLIKRHLQQRRLNDVEQFFINAACQRSVVYMPCGPTTDSRRHIIF